MQTQLIALLVTTALVVGGLAGTRKDSSSETPQTTAPAPLRYCVVATQLDRAGAATFRRLEQDPNASRRDFQLAETAFVRRHAAQLDALAANAPTEIAEEVRVLIASVRARAGLVENGPPGTAVRGAQRTVQQFERTNCPNRP